MLDFALRFFGQPGFDASSWPTVGVGLATLLCLVSVSVPWRDLPHYAVGVLPVLDVAAVGMARLDPQTSGAGVLVVIPAVWLGREFGRPGAVIALMASVLLMAVPGFVYSGGSAVNVSRLLLINFIASVSHERRTPLTSIIGYVQMLQERDDLTGEVHGQLDVVSRNSERLSRLVADLLHTAQSDEGPMNVVRVRIDGTRVELAVTDTGVGSRSRASRGMAAPSGCGCRAGPTTTDSARVPIATRTPDRRVRCRRGRCRRSPGRG